ncbi:RNA polymerase factor sigma-54 [candidate division KSB3 bacterium]|uniref:RNA polymerase factor sigma-54 n=1 Tax=candidate division KSB3 bacterium TaxID=2044937 RepID=A0A9D5JYQ2_9BACT|nr:RNA polymerase factor sigma-54 [candidate division KSB3 bacterium]MBD3326674.1 RNA polymerase factor sigma-54 [candidate division KSB3 bacterium]
MMNVDTRMNLNLSQRLVMTPMLQQAIRLLQMSRLELVDLVKQEMLENPVLDEVEDQDAEELPSETELSAEAEAPASDTEEPQTDQDDAEREDAAAEDTSPEDSINWEEYFDDNPASVGGMNLREYDPDEDTQSFENFHSSPPSLADHLAWQLQMSQLSERSQRIGAFLIGQIDDDGYLRCEDTPETKPQPLLSPKLSVEEREALRAAVVERICQKINVEFEREHLLATLNGQGLQRILLHVLIQEYYDDIRENHTSTVLARLQSFTLEDLMTLTHIMHTIPSDALAARTHAPISEIEQGIASITHLCRHLRSTLEKHRSLLIQGSYQEKLEKLDLSPEDLYLLEYLLSQLSAEEIAFVAAKEDRLKAEKYEKDLHLLLEKLRQSYAHIETLKSPKYFLIQLYQSSLDYIIEHDNHPGLHHHPKLFLKLSAITEDDVNDAAAHIQTHLAEVYHHEAPVSPAEVAQVLRHIQTFTPAGVGARDLQECLLLQIQALDLIDPVVEHIITTYLPELENGQYDTISKHVGISSQEVGLIHHIVANLSPRPATDFTPERAEYIIPDIYVYKIDDEYEVVLNEDDLPNLRINPTYRKIMTDNNHQVSNSARQYVDQKLRSAIWFIRSVEQRKRTMYKVGTSIVKFQREFLEHGISHLKPLVLRDVADDIGMHESTVSRVTTNKYIHTPQGVFELKYFFHSGLESSSGNDVSSIAIKERIKQLIDQEERTRPLSDKSIENQLKKAGVAIARRTVAKYREELGIPSSIHRKRPPSNGH